MRARRLVKDTIGVVPLILLAVSRRQIGIQTSALRPDENVNKVGQAAETLMHNGERWGSVAKVKTFWGGWC
jgi:hypothetical protein